MNYNFTSLEEEIRKIVRDEIEKEKTRRIGPVPYEPMIPTWPEPPNSLMRCSVCGMDRSKLPNYVCTITCCPSKVYYLAENTKTTDNTQG